MTLAGRMARFARDVDIEDVSDSALAAATAAIADALACAIGATQQPTTKLLRDYATRRSAHCQASLLGTAERVDVTLAALVNGSAVRDLDANDLYATAPGRDTGHFSDAVPALLAVAEQTGASGSELLAATVAVYELQAALAESYLWLDRGLHPVSQVAWAAPAAAGRLAGLSEEQIIHAIGLSGTTSGLILQSWLKPTTAIPSIKAASTGLVAMRALESVELAALGITAPPDALETLLDRLPSSVEAERFELLKASSTRAIERNIIKRYPAQIYTQAAVAAAVHLSREIESVDDIALATVYGHRNVAAGVQGSGAAYTPQTREAADHSTPFVVAMALRDGDLTPASYVGEPWRDPDMLDLMQRVDLVIDPDADRAFDEAGRIGCALVVEMVDGRRLEVTVDQPPGHPDNPLDRPQHLAKLRSLADPVLGDGTAERLLAASEALIDAPNLDALLSACRPR
jgi:2-methylcitrate dehydratase